MKRTKLIRKELLWEIAIFSFGLVSISLFHSQSILLTVLLLIGWMVGIRFWHEKHDFYFFITGAIVGPIGEIICIHFGAWSYAEPNFLGIPIWLPLVWGLYTMLIKRIVETFVKIEMK